MSGTTQNSRALWAGLMLASLLALAAPAQTTIPATAPERGIGPMFAKTARGNYVVRLLRRDRDMVWVLQRTQTGQFIEAGLTAREITGFEIPRPPSFAAAEQATTPEQVAQVLPTLTKLNETLRPFRDLPGMIADEGMILQAGLLVKQDRGSDALALYEDVAKQTYPSPRVAEAKLRAGLCLAHLGRNEDALKRLDPALVSDDDPILLSDVYYARGQALAATGQPKQALLSYLYLVVFYPFIQNNEPRCLEAALPCYIALKDWSAAFKTFDVLNRTYAGSGPAQRATDLLKPYEKEMANEQQFTDKE